MTWAIMLAGLLAAAVGQGAWPAAAWMGGVKAPFLLALTLYYALTRQTPVMLGACFLAGVLQDALSPIPLGYSSFCFCVAGWLAGRLRDLVMSDSLVTQVVLGASAAGAVTLVMAGLLAQAGLLVCPPGRLALRALGAVALGAAATPLVFVALGALDRLVGNVAAREPIDGFE
jgi:rod shape-determining protein MreD